VGRVGIDVHNNRTAACSLALQAPTHFLLVITNVVATATQRDTAAFIPLTAIGIGVFGESFVGVGIVTAIGFITTADELRFDLYPVLHLPRIIERTAD
jgi:hypothetical protein